MSLENIKGVIAIVLTPLTEDGSVDEAGVGHLVEACVEKNLDGVVVLGSNGEFPYLRFEDKVKVMSAAAKSARGRIPVIAGASAYGTDEASALAREAAAAGCDGVMVALPMYFKLGIKGVIKHFETVAKKGGLPMLFYYFPDVTDLVLSPGELSEIAAIDGIVGAKLTVINRSYLKRAVEATRPYSWKIFTGTSFLLHDCLSFGGAGVACPLGLIGADDVKGIYQAFKAGDMNQAKILQNKVRHALPLFSGIKLPPGLLAKGFEIFSRLPEHKGERPRASHGLLKEALRLQGYPITGKVAPPYGEATPEQKSLVKNTLKSLEWI